MNREVTRQIFNIAGLTEVYVINHQDVQFEIFISSKKERKVFSHVCLAFWKVEITYNNAIKGGYKTLIKKSEDHNTYFIWDKSENLFEIKEIT